MKKRVILTTVVSIVLLLAVILAGLNAVYTVASVRANFQTFSNDGSSEARELQGKLDSFLNSSTVFLDLEDLQAVVDEYPCFRLEEMEKRYPDRLQLKITERKETFSYCLDDGRYAILDEKGEFIYEKETDVNRTGGGNILLSGFDFQIDDEGVSGNYFEELAGVFTVLSETLFEVRANVLSITFDFGGDEGTTKNDFFSIQMREGVLIEIYNPHVKADEKTRLAIECYVSELKDFERVRGAITVVDSLSDDPPIVDYRA